MLNEPILTGDNYIAAVNGALEEAGLKIRVTTFISGHQQGIYCTDRLISTRGGHVMVSLYRNAQSGLHLKSVCRVRNKHQVASVLINKQAGCNTQELVWFHDLEGPVLNTMAVAMAG